MKVSLLFSLISCVYSTQSFVEYKVSGSKIHLESDQFPNGGDLNEQPVIGILTQTLEIEQQSDPRFENYTSYIMSSYVDFLMAAGARVVPLILSDSQEINLEKLKKLNGVLFPGGDGDYKDNGFFVWSKGLELNDNGTYFPMWGTCMGFQNISVWASEAGFSVLERYEMYQTSVSLEFTRDPRDTKMFGWLQDQAFFFEDHNLTYNSHNWSLDPDTFTTDAGLKEFFDVLAISYMPAPDNRPFVVAIEGKKYPVFATLFHPEQTSQSYYYSTVNHSWMSVTLNRHFADYFVWLARHSTNSYGDFFDVQKDIVQNYDTIVTDYNQGQVYVFK